jgi:hypothetical protein
VNSYRLVCLTSVTIVSTVFSLSACGGGGDTVSPTPTTTTGTSQTSSQTTSQTTTQTGSQTGGVSATTTNIATGDTINGLPITNATALTRLSAAVTAVPAATAQTEATIYPIAGKQFFRNLVSISGADSTLNIMNSATSSARTVTIVGEFQSFTAARVFPCTFNPTDYKTASGDCDTVNIAPGPYPAQSSAGSKCRDIAYKSGIIQQCIKD